MGLEHKNGRIKDSDKDKFVWTTKEQEILQGLKTELQKEHVIRIKITSIRSQNK